MMKPKYDVFLSHSAADRPWVRRLASSLKKQGLSIWIDEEQLGPGTDLSKAVVKGIQNSDLVVSVVDPSPAARTNVFLEAGVAIGLGKKVTFIIPKEKDAHTALPINASTSRVMFREAPAATARRFAHLKKRG
ncbi:MAG: toll/interleukin-1 receptor domain-containing protein [Acidobacteria bacterium]|nr:toll/interleukin-1 receptor domain-containing protein [Acidobacteriota bacterium]